MNKHSLLIIFILLIAGSSYYSGRINAQTTGTSSAQPDDETIKENIKQRIKRAIGNSDPNSSISVSTPLAWVGKVDNISAETLTMTVDTQTRLVAIESATVISQNNKPIKIEDLEIGSPVIAIGNLSSNDILSSQRIESITALPVKSNKQIIVGLITETNARTQLITVSPTGQIDTFILKVTRNTKIFDTMETKIPLKFAQLNPGDQLALIYQPDAKNSSVLNLLQLYRTVTAPKTEPNNE